MTLSLTSPQFFCLNICAYTFADQCDPFVSGSELKRDWGEKQPMMSTDSPQSTSDRLELLYDLSRAFNSTLDLDEVLNRVMDEVISITRAERGFVMLHEADGRLAFRVARGIDQTTIQDPQFQVSRSIVERVARDGEPLLTSDALQDDRLSTRRSVTILGLRSVLCVPLKTRDNISGVVYVDSRIRAGIFSRADLDLLTAIASSAAIAIENARLYQVAVERGRLERELQMARETQASLLPRETPQVPGWEFAARWQPARQVAGDYYDFIPLDDGKLGLVIADVSDKGMPAALFMAMTRSTIRASVGHAPSPVEGIALANRLICADAAGGMFVTLFYALLDPATGEMTYVNAGHNPPLLQRANGHAGPDHLVELGRTGMALGVIDDATFEQRSVQIQVGDMVLFYTDGITEAVDAQNQEFGIPRLLRVLENAQPAHVIDAIEAALHAYVGDTPPFDDMTIVALRRLQGPFSGGIK
jgi:sigma-B regulation protein RsbU (phosphoserine phosphatase)